MKTIVLYRQDTPSEYQTEEFVSQLQKRHIDHQLLEMDAVEAAAKIELYSLVQAPGVAVTTDDGQLIKSWVGTLPSIGEVDYYIHGQLGR